MAKKDAKADGKKGGGGGLIGVVLVTLIAVGAGAGFGFFISGQAGAPAAEAKAAEKEEKEKPKPTVTTKSTLVTMNPIVANLAQPADTWMRIEASILLEGMPEGGDKLAAQLSEDFVAYLRTATLSQFEGPSGFQNLREDFVDRATIRDREHIKDVIIHGVVIE